jgi:hypothetical protein
MNKRKESYLIWNAMNCLRYIFIPYLNSVQSYPEEYRMAIHDFMMEYGKDFCKLAEQEIQKRRARTKRAKSLKDLDELEQYPAILKCIYGI